MSWSSVKSSIKATAHAGPDRLLCPLASAITVAAMASYFVFYALAPWAYAFGPVVLFLLAVSVLVFRWPLVKSRLDRESMLLAATLAGYFLLQASVLTIHGEDLSEYDLSTRYLAAAMVLVVLLAIPVSTRALFFLAGLGALFTGLFTLYQLSTGSALRVQSFDNPIHYGNGALALCCLSIAGLVWAHRQPRRGVWAMFFVLGSVGGLVASILSATRSGWVAVPVLIFLTLYTYQDRIRAKRWLLPVILFVLVSSVGIASTLDVVRDRTAVALKEAETYLEHGTNHTSVGLRFDMYKAGLTAFRENPLVGAGPTATDEKIDELIQAGEIHPNVADFRHLHNQYIDNMARYGLLGLAAYLLLLGVPMYLFIRKARLGPPSVRALGLAGALFTALHAIVNLTQSMLERNIGVMMFLFVIVFLWVTLKQDEAASSQT